MMERRKRKSKVRDIERGIPPASFIGLWALCLLPGCFSPSEVDDSWRCDPRILNPGESRVRRIPCSDELIDGGEGQKGDWLLENSQIRFIIRDAPMALTQLGTAGGSIIDVAEPNGEDGIIELLPRFDDSFLTSAEIEMMDSPMPGLLIRGTLADGTLATVEMKLAADSATLLVDGPDSWLGVLPAESMILSQSIEMTVRVVLY